MAGAVAQTLSGQVRQSGGEPVPFANVRVWRASDSALVTGAVADENGRVALHPPSGKKYRISADGVGFAGYVSDDFAFSGDTALVLTLAAQNTDLQEVTIKSGRPPYEQQLDKLVVHVSSLVTATGGTALDVLERVPGVTVNRQQQALSLAGRPGVTILVDGKMMPVQTVMALLSALPAHQIERIEVMSGPSARYDAEGTGGIIHLILKKNALNGWNGSWQLSAGIGRYEKLNGHARLAWRRERWSVQGDLSVTRDREWQLLTLRNEAVAGDVRVSNQTRKESFHIRPFQQFRLSADYAANARTTVGVILSGFRNGFRAEAPARWETERNGHPEQPVFLSDKEKNHWLYGMVSGYVQRKFGADKSLSVDLDYIRYANSNPHDYTSLQGTDSQIFRTRKETPIRLWVGKSDFSVKQKDGSTLDIGVKASLSSLTNDVRVDYLRNAGWQPDTSLTRLYRLRENILAGYATWVRPLGRSSRLQVGLRYEHTGFSIPEAGIDRQYGSWFPGIHFSRDWTAGRSFQASYSRRIQRPGYDLLAPWVMFLNPYTFISGNTALLPAFTDMLQASYRFRGAWLVSASYLHDRHALDRFRVRTDALTNRSYITPQNVNTRHTWSVQLSLPLRITRGWSVQTQATGLFVSQHTPVDGRPLRQQQWAANLYSGHSFSLTVNLTAEVTATYQSPVLSGITRMRGQGSVNLGIRKKWAAGSLALTVSDLFRTTTLYADNTGTTDVSHWAQFYEPRVIRLTWARSFGRNLLPAARRASGSEDERGRVSSN